MFRDHNGIKWRLLIILMYMENGLFEFTFKKLILKFYIYQCNVFIHD